MELQLEFPFSLAYDIASRTCLNTYDLNFYIADASVMAIDGRLLFKPSTRFPMNSGHQNPLNYA